MLSPEGSSRTIQVWCDSDWAGDRTTRRSVDCIVVRVLGTVLHTSTKGQTAIAQSSAEAELGAAHRGALYAIGIQNMWSEFFGEHLNIEILTDSMAAKLISTRRGVGRVRHLEIRQLYLQKLTNGGRVKILKCKGTQNLADAGTKPMPKKAVEGFRVGLGIVRRAAVGAESPGRGVDGIMALPAAAKRHIALLLASMLIGESDAAPSDEVKEHQGGTAVLEFRCFLLLIFLAGWFAHMSFAWAWRTTVEWLTSTPAPILRSAALPPPASTTTTRTTSTCTTPPDIPAITQQTFMNACYVSSGGERFHVDRECRGLVTAGGVSRRTPCMLCGGKVHGGVSSKHD